MEKIQAAMNEMALLRKRFSITDDPEKIKYIEQEFDTKIGELLKCFKFEALPIPASTDLALVSIGLYDSEDWWGCRTFDFLVEKEAADKAFNAGLSGLKEYYSTDFYDRCTNLFPSNLVRLFIFATGATVYQEFVPDDTLKEEFVDPRHCGG